MSKRYQILENLRTHGGDPMFRKSMWSSGGIHVMAIIVIPLLLSTRGGCVDPYKIQGDSGMSTYGSRPQSVIVKPRPKRLPKYVLASRSAILWRPPRLDDSPTQKDVDQASQLPYQADPMRVLVEGPGGPGQNMGQGNDKGRGGWPGGSANAKFRFVRLEYNGEGWDDGMDAVSRSDRNFLDEFRRETGFKTAEASESHPIALLRKYPKGLAPPFVFMSGRGDINVSQGDMMILREYLLDGGMLFADCSSPQWDRSFRGFIQSVFPGQQLSAISDDDPIFQTPHAFANGAPSLWHHGGTRALGIKNRDRWVVFYHPGDIHDAWKTGRSGMAPELAKQAMGMGINIVYYSFTHYLDMTRRYQK